jgi:gamma-glutamyltranspeptidase / glutathione hydrolase
VRHLQSPILARCLLAGILITTGCHRAERWTMYDDVQAVRADSAMVVSVSPIATQVGVDVLRHGGNAVDAAVAVGFALAVVHPAAGNIGGGGFMVFRFASGETAAIDYRETAPAGATHDMYLDSAGNVTDASVTGHLAVGVPGSVAGMFEAHRRYGKLPWADIVAPAVRLARDGFVVDGYRARGITSNADRLARFPASARQFLSGGVAPDSGATLEQADLARALQAIADSGPGVFYQGWIADSIVAEMARGNGLMSKNDLAAYRPLWREPVTFTYRGYTVHSMPPSSSGGVTLALILNMLEGNGSLPSFDSPAHVHLLTEVMRRAFADRNAYLGDPAFVTMPMTELASKSYADRRRADIQPDEATPSADVEPGIHEGDHTTHFSVVDAEGNAVAVTTTLNSGFGSAVTVSGAGFLLNDEMDDFTAAPGRPNMYGLVQGEANAIQPGKRMLSAMTPTIVDDPHGRLFLVLGSPGGPTIITTVAQVISNVIDFHMSLDSAVAAPRIHHQHLPDTLRYEHAGLDRSTVAALRRMGYALDERRGYSGEVAAIMRVATGWIGVEDPRTHGAAEGY